MHSANKYAPDYFSFQLTKKINLTSEKNTQSYLQPRKKSTAKNHVSFKKTTVQ